MFLLKEMLHMLFQPPPPSISNLYSNDSLSQAAADSNSMPQDEFATVQMKCGRYESHTYERDGQHNHHQADRPDLNEENTADADPSTDSTKEGEYLRGSIEFRSRSGDESVNQTQTDNALAMSDVFSQDVSIRRCRAGPAFFRGSTAERLYDLSQYAIGEIGECVGG